MIFDIQHFLKPWFILVLASYANAFMGSGNQRKSIYRDVIPLQARSPIGSSHIDNVEQQTEYNSQSHGPPSEYTTPSTSTTSTTTPRDWKTYALQQKYKKAGGMLYKQSLLSPREYSILQRELKSSDEFKMKEESESSFATNRIGATISEDSDVWRVLSSEEGSLCRFINCLADADCDDDDGDGKEMGKMILAPDIPIEIRVYEKRGAGMEWHVDDVLYRPKQIEVVLTIDNTSDCCTMWKPHDRPITPNSNENENNNNQNDHESREEYEVQSAQTTPNSALILEAGSVEHKVSPLKAGRRTILKMAFARENSVLLEGMEGRASHHGAKHRKNTKRRSGTKKKKKGGGGTKNK